MVHTGHKALTITLASFYHENGRICQTLYLEAQNRDRTIVPLAHEKKDEQACGIKRDAHRQTAELPLESMLQEHYQNKVDLEYGTYVLERQGNKVLREVYNYLLLVNLLP